MGAAGGGAVAAHPLTIAASAGGHSAGGAGSSGGAGGASGHGAGPNWISMSTMLAAGGSNVVGGGGASRGRVPLMRAGSRLQIATTPTTQPSIPEDMQALDTQDDFLGNPSLYGGMSMGGGAPLGSAATTPPTYGGTHGEERRRLLIGLAGSAEELGIEGAEGADGTSLSPPLFTARALTAFAAAATAAEGKGRFAGHRPRSCQAEPGSVTAGGGGDAVRSLFRPSPTPVSGNGSGGEVSMSHGSHRHVQEVAVGSSRPQTAAPQTWRPCSS
jgi:hypothetical protein